jgi:hypothetical protein
MHTEHNRRSSPLHSRRLDRAANLIVTAALARKSKNRAAVLARVLDALRAAKGRKAHKVVRKLMPELIPEMVVSA